MRRIAIVLYSVCLVVVEARLEAQAAPAKPNAVMITAGSPNAPKMKPLLPDAFAGWVASEPLKTVSDAAEADNANAAALKEYDFTGATLASYKRGSETLNVQAMRFRDLSGAYGAYSFYRQNGWPKADIGAGATSNKNRVLFWQGNTVVDANFSHLGPMSAAELRELAKNLPAAAGKQGPTAADSGEPSAGVAGQADNTLCARACGLCGCGRRVAAGTGGIRSRRRGGNGELLARSGSATLTLIDYPTPQMAEAQEKKIRAYIKAGARPSRRFRSRCRIRTKPRWR